VSDFPESNMNDLEIKKRARRRLVGATILALLAVIVLPAVLFPVLPGSSEESGNVPDIRVSIPEHGVPGAQALPEGEPEIAQVDEPDAAPSAPEIPLSEPSPPPASPPQVQPPQAKPVAQQTVPEQSIPENPSQHAGHPSRDNRHEKPPPRPGTAERDAEAARALALLNEKPSVKEAGGKAGKAQSQVFIQVGAYNKADGANKQVEKLKRQGFSAYAEKSGKVVRVRIGPLPQNEGERLIARLKAQGHNPVLSSR